MRDYSVGEISRLDCCAARHATVLLVRLAYRLVEYENLR